MSNLKVLLIGKIPPPIGGVTIHVRRLIDRLSELSDINASLYDLSEGIRWRFFAEILKSDVVHCHTSSPYLRLITSLICLVFRRKLIVTFHGSLGRYGKLLNLIDALTVRLCRIPLVLNQSSFDKAIAWNKRTRIVSAYVSSDDVEILGEAETAKLDSRAKGKTLFCTNAFDVTFDVNGHEIYGISNLLKLFKQHEDKLLVVSDPSGNYQRYIQEQHPELVDVAYFISYPHDSRAVLTKSRGFIRNTATDGDSLSIHEALSFSVPCYCTNVVSRPAGAITYDSIQKLDELLSSAGPQSESQYHAPDTVLEVVRSYQS